MALIAEELVEEWLNRQGFFTIRGARVGNNEMDILAIRITASGQWERWHYEVSGTVAPIGWLSRLTKEIQRTTGRPATSSAKRSPEDLKASVAEWVHKKFGDDELEAARQKLCPGPWRVGLVYTEVKHEDELSFIEGFGIELVPMKKIVDDLLRTGPTTENRISKAKGADLAELVAWARRRAS